jgi:hypothetical protein
MTTLNDIVTGALRKLVIVDETENPSAALAAYAVTVLVDMANAWPATSIHTGWNAAALTDEFPLEARHVAGVKAMLAKSISEDMGKQVSPNLRLEAMRGENALRADYQWLEPSVPDTTLITMPSQRNNWRA